MIVYLYVCCVERINLDEHIYMQIVWKENKFCILLRLTLMVQDEQAKEGLKYIDLLG